MCGGISNESPPRIFMRGSEGGVNQEFYYEYGADVSVNNVVQDLSPSDDYTIRIENITTEQSRIIYRESDFSGELNFDVETFGSTGAIRTFYQDFEQGCYLQAGATADDPSDACLTDNYLTAQIPFQTKYVEAVSAADGQQQMPGSNYSLRWNHYYQGLDPITGEYGLGHDEPGYRHSPSMHIPFGEQVQDEVYVKYNFWFDEGNDNEYYDYAVPGIGCPIKLHYLVFVWWVPNLFDLIKGSDPVPAHLRLTCNGYEPCASPAYVSSTAPITWQNGVWHEIAFYGRTESVLGARDGIFRQWFDGELVIDESNVPWGVESFDYPGNLDLSLMYYGGGCLPYSSFGVSMDNIEVWNGMPG